MDRPNLSQMGTTQSTSEALLSTSYHSWVEQLLGGPIPLETKASCEQCAMLPQPDSAPSSLFFDASVKCCGYLPDLPNYRVGSILADREESGAGGRRTIEERLAKRIAVTPLGFHQSGKRLALYAPQTFGKAPELVCPHLVGGGCGIWRHRPAVCATWFCKHNRGATGSEFWKAVSGLLAEVDLEVSIWCALELGISPETVAGILNRTTAVSSAELGGQVDQAAFDALWGSWQRRETEFYERCRALVEPLSWTEIAALAGPRVELRSRLVQESYQKLLSQDLPRRPRTALFQIEGVSGKFRTITYSPFDPLLMTPAVAALLVHFDGRPTEDVLAELALKNIKVSPGLIRRLADHRLIVETAEPG